jgi:DNA-binding HxlR family transcriptional regulator
VPETPVRVEYALTRKGRALGAVITGITRWAHVWVPIQLPPAKKRSRQRR